MRKNNQECRSTPFWISFLLLSICLLSWMPRARAASTRVQLSLQYPAGSIVIVPERFALYYIESDHMAVRYPIGVPKVGKDWSGEAVVVRKDLKPAWSPPAEVKRDFKNMPDVIEGGAVNNPMGAAAISLDREEIAIHGTPAKFRKSVGTRASYGCIRMLDEDVLELFDLVKPGTPVYMR